MITVIIPVYNEETALSENSHRFRGLREKAELIFVDGGSSDRSAEVAERYGKILSSAKSRAIQMNAGARSAKEETLLFLHADNTVSPDAIISIENHIKNGFIGGCLTQRIDKGEAIYRFIEWQGNRRARRTGVFYGDQGIFVRKDMFLKINGFPEAPIMEDVLFTKRLKKLGKTGPISDKIIVSPRRWEKRGVIKTIFLYNLIILLFWLKFPLERIKRLYDDLR